MSAPTPPDHTTLGHPPNFWLHSTHDGFDLTHPPTPLSPAITPRLHLSTTTAPITIDPCKTALVIIDMQNFFLHPALGRLPDGPGHKACDALLTLAIPAARKAGIQVVWLNWGLTEGDLVGMPPATIRAFGFETVEAGGEGERGMGKEGEEARLPDEMARVRRAPATMTENGKDGRIYKGLGADLGPVVLHSTSPSPDDGPSTETIRAGRLLMRHTWNASLYPPLQASYSHSLTTRKPDAWIHKNRMSGLWGAATPCTEYLEAHGLRTLLFAGVNTDQCVAGSVQDAFAKGWDCVLLSDACGTSSPAFATRGVEFNCARSWGFVVGCGELGRGVEGMVGEG